MGAPRRGGLAPDGERFPRVVRVRRGNEIRALLREGRRGRGEWLEVFSAPSSGNAPRLGTVVPRYGRTVVERNLLRRRLREIGRTVLLPRLRERGCSLDLLIRARPRGYDASFPDLRDELTRLTERLCFDGS